MYINENFTNIKSDISGANILNKSINNLENNDINLSLMRSITTESQVMESNKNQIILNNNLHEKENSFLSKHTDDINVVVEMSNLMFPQQEMISI